MCVRNPRNSRRRVRSAISQMPYLRPASGSPGEAIACRLSAVSYSLQTNRSGEPGRVVPPPTQTPAQQRQGTRSKPCPRHWVTYDDLPRAKQENDRPSSPGKGQGEGSEARLSAAAATQRASMATRCTHFVNARIGPGPTHALALATNRGSRRSGSPSSQPTYVHTSACHVPYRHMRWAMYVCAPLLALAFFHFPFFFFFFPRPPAQARCVAPSTLHEVAFGHAYPITSMHLTETPDLGVSFIDLPGHVPPQSCRAQPVVCDLISLGVSRRRRERGQGCSSRARRHHLATRPPSPDIAPSGWASQRIASHGATPGHPP